MTRCFVINTGVWHAIRYRDTFSFSVFLASYSLSHFSFLTRHLRCLLHMTRPLPGSSQEKSVGLIAIVVGPFGLRSIHRTLSSVNVRNLAIARIGNFKHRGKRTRLCQKTRCDIGFLPGMGVSITVTSSRLSRIVSVIDGTTCAKGVNSNGVFITRLRHIVHVHANRTSRTTLWSLTRDGEGRG